MQSDSCLIEFFNENNYEAIPKNIQNYSKLPTALTYTPGDIPSFL